MMNKILIFMVAIRIIMLFIMLFSIYETIKSKYSKKEKKVLLLEDISKMIVVLLFAEIAVMLVLHEETENIFEKIGCYLDKISYKIYKFLKKVIK